MPTIEEIMAEYETGEDVETESQDPVVLDPNSDASVEDLMTEYEGRTFMGAVEEGVGGSADILGYDVPIPFGGLVNNVGDLIGGAGRMGAKIASHLGKRFMDPFGVSEEGQTIEQQIMIAMQALIKENIRMMPQEIADWNQRFLEAREAGASPEELQAMTDEMRRIEERLYPVTTEIERILGKEFAWMTDKQEFYRKIAEEPAEMLSDVASAVSSAFTGGASALGTKAPKLAQILNKVADIADKADPMQLPQNIIGGIDAARKPASAEGFRPEAAEAAERFGAGKEMTPDTVLNPNLETREYLMGGLEGRAGIETRERLDATLQAIDDSKRRMTEALAKGVDPYNAEVAGKSVLDAYQVRQFEDKVAFKKKFQEIRANFTDEVPTGYEWRKNLDATLAELKPTQVDPQELQKVRVVVDDILGDVDTSQLTLADIDAFRTEFRQRMMTQFRQGEINVIGSGSMTEKVYNAITEDLYDAIETTVQASGGRLPDTLLQDVRRAKAEYRDLKMLEDTEGGKFLIRNQDKPQALVNGLLGNQLSTDEIKNVYKLIGQDASADIQATLMNQIFQTSSKGALGLQNRIAALTKNNPDRIAELFGGGDRGAEIAADLDSFADFIASTERVRLRDRGTITGRANQMLAGGTGLGVVTMSMDMARTLIWSGDPTAVATVGASLAITSLASTGYLKWATSDIGRRRLREGLGDETADAFFKVLDNATQRGVVKPLELGSRLEGEEE